MAKIMDSQNFELSPPEIENARETDSANNKASYSRKTPSVGLDDASSTPQTEKSVDKASAASNDPPPRNSLLAKVSPFWRDRFIEAGLILSIALYYITGNANLGTGGFFHLNPLFSLPFLLLFAALCWYRLPFAVALLPLALPYYPLPKTVFSHYSFSLAEITLGVCLLVAFIQLLLWRNRWQYWLSWQELRDRVGPFIIPILVFLLAAAFSVVLAYA